jgi:hypothetical protein
MTTLAIFDELVNSGFETNVLKTRENVIIQLAHNHIKSIVLSRKYELVNIYSEVKSYAEIYLQTLKASLPINLNYLSHRSLNNSMDGLVNILNSHMKSLYEKVQNLLTKFQKLESEFPPNIFLWNGLKGYFSDEITSLVPELLLPNEMVNQIKQLDVKYENFTREFNTAFNIYLNNNFDPKRIRLHLTPPKFKAVNDVLAKSLELDFDT